MVYQMSWVIVLALAFIGKLGYWIYPGTLPNISACFFSSTGLYYIFKDYFYDWLIFQVFLQSE